VTRRPSIQSVHRVATASAGQEPVSLVAADGETLSGDVQSNFASNGWATRNGFTRARDVPIAAPDASTLDGWDDVNFVPIAIWAADFSQTSTNWDRIDDVAVNGFLPASGSVVLDTAITREKWVTVPIADWPSGTIPSDEDPAVLGVIPGEEPSTTVEYQGHITDGDTWLDSAEGTGRFLHYNYADNLVNGEIASTYFPEDMVLCETNTQPPRVAFITMDIYWFAGAHTGGGNTFKLFTRLYLDEAGSAPASLAQTARGSNYGSCMDAIRKAYPAGQPGWFLCWIETGAPYEESASQAITAAQLGWAVWSTLVHGARGIAYFVHNFRIGDSWGAAPWDDHFGGPGVAGTGIYAAMKQIDERAMDLASVLNSPKDGYLCFGDGLEDYEQPGFLTACTSTNARDMFSGVDASCRWQPVEEKHYILATTREQDGTTNWPVTFRMVDQGQTTAVEVHESNSISIQRGGGIPGGFCEFSDTFATAASYKAYRID
jgi:hypothetical protein